MTFVTNFSLLLLMVNSICSKDIKLGSLSSPEECQRVCTKSNTPKNCYYHFHVEEYVTISKACDYCTKNKTNNCQCVYADGVEKSIFTVNRMIPGPSIEVCEGDQIIVDMENMALVDSTIHWHGVFQPDTPHYDGASFVTQCPTFSGNTFRYNFTAFNSGSHFWHGHVAFLRIEGITGPLIIRQIQDPSNVMYDYDLSDHIIFVQDWLHELTSERFPGRRFTQTGQAADNILINGKGIYMNPLTGLQTNSSMEKFTVAFGKRYRFRFINACATVCPIQIFVEGHNLTIISTDGEPIQPINVTSIISASGERYDFIINANQEPRIYWIQIKGLGECESSKLQQLATLEYESSLVYYSYPPTYDYSLFPGKVVNPLDGNCRKAREDAICVNQFVHLKNVDARILKNKPDLRIILPFSFYLYDDMDLFVSNSYKPFFVSVKKTQLLGMMDEISYADPPSPLISQYKEINPSRICNRKQNMLNCSKPCICTHVITIPLNAVVDVILLDNSTFNDKLTHPFHLHGFTFHILGLGKLTDLNRNVSLEDAIDMNIQSFIGDRLGNPPAKDTVLVPNQGYATIRFKAKFPGFWLFHCHFLLHMLTGMSVVFQVGTLDEMPSVPRNFPKCGNFVP